MATPDTRLKDIAHDLLDSLVTGLGAAGLDVPERQYVHHGNIAIDFAGRNCVDQLTVAFAGIIQGGANTDLETVSASIPGSIIRAAVPLVAAYNICLFRCVPTLRAGGKAPTADELGEKADDLFIDSMTLPAVIIDLELAGNLLPSFPSCSLVGLGAVQPYGPQGGAGGTVLSVFVSLV